MLKVFYLVAILFSTQVLAQLYTPSSDSITEAEAKALFAEFKVENEKMEERSECFERAHMWSLRAERLHGIKMEKVFLFFTYKFQMKHRVTSRMGRAFTWWFHVAPAVRVNGELVVMDATFNDEYMSVNDWARSLMKDPEDCLEMLDRNEYALDRNSTQGYANVSNAYSQCYYIASPRFFYQPVEMGFREASGGVMQVVEPLETPTEWRPFTFNWGLNSYKRSERKEARKILGF